MSKLQTDGGDDLLADDGQSLEDNAPTITSAELYPVRVLSAVSYQILANGSPTSYAATGLPAGLSLNTSTGLISGTALLPGTSVAILTATNAAGTSSPFPLTLQIQPINMSANQDTLAYPNPTNWLRATGRLYIAFDDRPGFELDMGDVEMSKLDYGTSEIETLRNRAGSRSMAGHGLVETKPKWSVTLNEYQRFNIGMLVFGTELAALAQTAKAAPTGTKTFNLVKPFDTLPLDDINVSTVVVKVATVTKVEGTDYLLNAQHGKITIMDGGSIADGDTVVVTYGCPSISRAQYQAFSRLNRLGTGKLIIDDGNSDIPKGEWRFRANFYAKQFGDIDAKKFSQAEFMAAIVGATTFLLRKD